MLEPSEAIDNPLVWPVYSLLKSNPKSWKLNELYLALQRQGITEQLDQDPGRQLFKINFLLMNALYQLRDLLGETQALMISVLDIRLLDAGVSTAASVDKWDALGAYYLDWQNFEASSEQVHDLLSSFWRGYRRCHGGLSVVAREQALALFELDSDASPPQIRQQWRRLALRWHPDRAGGDEEKFKALCEAWQSLR